MAEESKSEMDTDAILEHFCAVTGMLSEEHSVGSVSQSNV